VITGSQAMPLAPWRIPQAQLNNEAVRLGVRNIIGRRPRITAVSKDEITLRLPGI